VAPQISSRQFLHAGVEGNQNAVPFHRLPEEQSVRPLLMSPDSCGQGASGRRVSRDPKARIHAPRGWWLRSRPPGRSAR
jgi:hypothetical protein